jgi:hypothetical protein
MNNLAKSVIVSKKMNKLNIISNNIIQSKINLKDLLNHYYNTILCGLLSVLIYFIIYFSFLLVLDIIFNFLADQKIKKGDIVQITTEPWKGYVGKVTKVGFLTNNIKITKNLNPFKKIPKRIVQKTVNEIKQT